MADEIKAIDATTLDPERLRAADAELKQLDAMQKAAQVHRRAEAYTQPTPDELIRRFTDGAQDWAAGLHSIRLAVYGMDPAVRERAEKVLAELLHAHAVYGNGRHGGQQMGIPRPW